MPYIDENVIEHFHWEMTKVDHEYSNYDQMDSQEFIDTFFTTIKQQLNIM